MFVPDACPGMCAACTESFLNSSIVYKNFIFYSIPSCFPHSTFKKKVHNHALALAFVSLCTSQCVSGTCVSL